MSLTAEQSAFVADHVSAAMITVDADGVPKPVRIAYQIVDGRIWSSGTQLRVRTRHLRRDPRATMFIWDTAFDFLTVHANVTILDGPDAAEINLRYFRQLQGRPEGPLTWMREGEYDDAAFLALMREDQRLIYEFEPTGAFGSFPR